MANADMQPKAKTRVFTSFDFEQRREVAASSLLGSRETREPHSKLPIGR